MTLSSLSSPADPNAGNFAFEKILINLLFNDLISPNDFLYPLSCLNKHFRSRLHQHVHHITIPKSFYIKHDQFIDMFPLNLSLEGGLSTMFLPLSLPPIECVACRSKGKIHTRHTCNKCRDGSKAVARPSCDRSVAFKPVPATVPRFLANVKSVSLNLSAVGNESGKTAAQYLNFDDLARLITRWHGLDAIIGEVRVKLTDFLPESGAIRRRIKKLVSHVTLTNGNASGSKLSWSAADNGGIAFLHEQFPDLTTLDLTQLQTIQQQTSRVALFDQHDVIRLLDLYKGKLKNLKLSGVDSPALLQFLAEFNLTSLHVENSPLLFGDPAQATAGRDFSSLSSSLSSSSSSLASVQSLILTSNATKRLLPASATMHYPARFLELFTSLTTLDLSLNEMTSAMQPLPWLNESLTALDLSSNLLTGVIPPLPPLLTSLNLSANRLEGAIPELPKSLTSLSLHTNKLTGRIPPLPPKLQTLDVSLNQLTHELPDLPNTLRELQVSYNDLAGEVPKSIVDCHRLLTADFFDNTYLNGTLPRGFEKMQSLNTLDLRKTKVNVPKYSYNCRVAVVIEDATFTKIAKEHKMRHLPEPMPMCVLKPVLDERRDVDPDDAGKVFFGVRNNNPKLHRVNTGTVPTKKSRKRKMAGCAGLQTIYEDHGEPPPPSPPTPFMPFASDYNYHRSEAAFSIRERPPHALTVLANMGFAEDLCREALEEAEGDVGVAAEALADRQVADYYKEEKSRERKRQKKMGQKLGIDDYRR